MEFSVSVSFAQFFLSRLADIMVKEREGTVTVFIEALSLRMA